MRRIVVGVDGSPGSVAALSWAAGLAKETGAELDAVTAWELSYAWIDGYAPDIVRWAEEARRDAEERLGAAITAAGVGAEVTVTRTVVEGATAQALLDASKDADLLVVGSRGRGGFAGLLLGSVSQQCVHHARVPVTVVPQPE
ncbi:MAG TPA: universal stress protein [Acidimicrobiales bacterium]|nr:universal stress protein [Acidimicrobiales bacterium]